MEDVLLGMDWTTVLLVPAVVVVTAGIFYLYSTVLRLMSKTTVRNKVVVITDALSGLGNECAKVFHKGGARLVLCGKSWEKLDTLAEQLANNCDPTVTFPSKLVLLDFSDMEELPDVISEVLECYGCLDVLIINGSMKVKAPVQDLSLEMDKAIMDINYFGPITLAKGILPSMISRRSGHILLINSIQGKLALPFRTTYAASKHAVQAFFDCLRAEVQEYGISVSTISHTFISSPPPTEETPVPAEETPVPTEETPVPTEETPVPTEETPVPAEETPVPAEETPVPVSSRKAFSLGIAPEHMAAEIVKTLSTKKKEVVLARSISKAVIYARAFFPNFVFSVMAAGVQNSATALDQDL
ncbi:dehydrogenase/reductase SDR family member 7C-B [Alosa sapidissima]|uniref:dehydrogenase/reductase SDR family member 7C-B n=1 Tax=Alosa sapidissima TaxID=34773 RepID=UPI001C081106|nr:dehydrogenase/reductase SDR family member 7C-B [Alosa sapidissima]XP_041943299.1 dehydrogenase/reductase SDR family member 7C-B [Alosa sapidissima]